MDLVGLTALTRHVLEENKFNTLVSDRYGYTMLGMEQIFLNRTVLKAPRDYICQWYIVCFVVFDKIKACVCRKFLLAVFQNISDSLSFSDHKFHCRILTYILINSFCM